MVALSQNLIGYNEKEILKYMKENQNQMTLDNVKNDKFYYLKYSNNSDTQTLLFFFNPDSVCHGVRLICEMSVKAEKVKEFNSIYRKVDETRWIDSKNDNEYLIEMLDEKWSCIVNIKPKK